MVVTAERTAPRLGANQERLLRIALSTGSLRVIEAKDKVAAAALNGMQMLARDGKDAGLYTPMARAFDIFSDWGYRPKTATDAPMMIRIADIEIGRRLRAVDPERVAALAASFAEIGMRTPITVARLADGRFRLSAGAHRLEAQRLRGETSILSFVRDSDRHDDELWEIDENLCRADLTPADRALFVFRRKEIYLLKHPETEHGVNQHTQRRSRQVGDSFPWRFTAATAAASGRSERGIQRDAERGEKISDKALRLLRTTHLDKGVHLDRLARLAGEDSQIRYVEEMLAADRAVQKDSKAIRTRKLEVRRASRTNLIAAIAQQGTVTDEGWPLASFAIGYADPPWEQQAWSDETGQDKGLMYPAMALNAIMDLCRGARSPFTRDAKLYLWVPANRLHHGIGVMEAWGFAYVTNIVWDKVHIGMGREVRDRHEHLLIGKRGDFPGLAEGSAPPSLFSEIKGRHSAKPVQVAAMIERLHPDLPKLELFQRRASLAADDPRLAGRWQFWGNESGVAG